jgi:soluble lytic murein transglycosylase
MRTLRCTCTNATLVAICVLCTSAGLWAGTPTDSIASTMRSGQYTRAIHLIETRSADLSDSLTRVRLAICYLKSGHPDRALGLFPSSSTGGIRTRYLRYWRACALLESGSASESIPIFRNLSISGSDALADSSAIALLRAARAAGDSVVEYQAVRALCSQSDGLAARGWEWRAIYELDRGGTAWIASWLEVLQRHPGSRSAYRVSLRALAADWNPTNAWLVKLARMFEHHGDWARAIETWKRGLSDPQLSGRETEISFYLARAHLRLRHYRDSRRYLARVLDDETDTRWRPRALRLAALSHRRAGNEERTRMYERKFLREFSRHKQAPDALWNVAMSWERQKRFWKAIRVYDELARRYPLSTESEKGRWRAGFCLYLLHRYGSAHKRFASLAGEARQYFIADQARYWAAKSLAADGKRSRARETWDVAAAYAPRSYYSIAAAVRADRPTTPPEDESPSSRIVSDSSHPRLYAEAHWLASLGEWRWARAILEPSAKSFARSVSAKEIVADAYEQIGDTRMSFLWRSRAMWSRLAESRYHECPPETLRRIWPDFYRDEVEDAAGVSGVSPYLLWAIMRQESVFDPQVTSSADARGLMQMIPPTGRAMARREHMPGYTALDLYVPSVSIRFGARYIASLLKRFSGDISQAAAGYNAGPHNVKRWVKLGRGDRDVYVESITYSETRKYVKLVLRNYHIYRSLHGGESVTARSEDDE